MKDYLKQEVIKHCQKAKSFLEIGCAEGNLLHQIRQDNPQANLIGIDINQSYIAPSLNKGINIIHGNSLEILPMFDNNQFETVIMNETMQEIKQVIQVLTESLRIGREVIYTFPNFGHYSLRRDLILKGKMPTNPALKYKWYNTPNVRFHTLLDLHDLAKDLQFSITTLKGFTTSGKKIKYLNILGNWRTQIGFAILSKK